jgi:hypothetical protein
LLFSKKNFENRIKMLSIARKSALSGNISRIAQRSIATTAIRPVVLVPGQQLNQRRQYTNASATAEKVMFI